MIDFDRAADAIHEGQEVVHDARSRILDVWIAGLRHVVKPIITSSITLITLLYCAASV